ncbi:TPA: hypothetical protein SAQ65_005943 [Bacillus cereus]|nr:hypothetical protein [Bacillus cereus]
MKITDELMKEIEEMEKANFPEEKIKKYLNLKGSVSEVKEEFRKYDGYVTVSDSVELLKPYLGTLKDDKSYELKILRMIKGDKKRGILPQIEASKPSNKIGYRIKKEEIERFINEFNKTKEDWKTEAKQSQKDAKEWEEKALELEKQASDWEKQALHYKKLYEASLEKKPSEVVETVPEGQMNIEDVEAEEVVKEVNTEQSEAPKVKKKPNIGAIRNISTDYINENKTECMIEFRINKELAIIKASINENGVWTIMDKECNGYSFEELEKTFMKNLEKEWADGKGKKVDQG